MIFFSVDKKIIMIFFSVDKTIIMIFFQWIKRLSYDFLFQWIKRLSYEVFFPVDKTIIISEHNLKLNWNDFYSIYTSNINSNIPQLHLFIFIKVASTVLVAFKTSIHPSLCHLLHDLLGPQTKLGDLLLRHRFLLQLFVNLFLF